MTAEADKSTRVIHLWYNGTWYNSSAADGSDDFYRDGIVVNVKFNEWKSTPTRPGYSVLTRPSAPSTELTSINILQD